MSIFKNGEKTKLTAVSISYNGRKYQGFHQCVVTETGKTVLPGITLDAILRILGVPDNATYTVG